MKNEIRKLELPESNLSTSRISGAVNSQNIAHSRELRLADGQAGAT